MTRERAIELLESKRTKLKFDPGTGEPDTFADCEEEELYDALLMAIKDMELIREALIVGFNGEEVVFHDSGMTYAIHGKPQKQMERKCPRNKDNPMKAKVEVAGVKMEAVKEPVDRGYLIDWYINSISQNDAPVWTEDHIDELVADFNVFPRKKL